MRKSVLIGALVIGGILGGCGNNVDITPSEESVVESSVTPTEKPSEYKPWEDVRPSSSVGVSSEAVESSSEEVESSSEEQIPESSSEEQVPESSSMASESAEHHFDDTYVEVDWFKSDFSELGLESYEYVALTIDSLNFEGLEDLLPEWARVNLIFYPDDSEFILRCFAAAREIYGNNISFEETESKSWFSYDKGYAQVYNVDGVDICFVFDDVNVYVYSLAIEDSIR